MLDDDEDEFGLPSLAGAYQKPSKKKASSTSSAALSKTISNKSTGSGAELNLWRADSGDLAELRGLPSYPTTKPSEGKILRPQYKDILRGKSGPRAYTRPGLRLLNRSRKLAAPY
jgi:hypothetical protein